MVIQTYDGKGMAVSCNTPYCPANMLRQAFLSLKCKCWRSPSLSPDLSCQADKCLSADIADIPRGPIDFAEGVIL